MFDNLPQTVLKAVLRHMLRCQEQARSADLVVKDIHEGIKLLHLPGAAVTASFEGHTYVSQTSPSQCIDWLIPLFDVGAMRKYCP